MLKRNVYFIMNQKVNRIVKHDINSRCCNNYYNYSFFFFSILLMLNVQMLRCFGKLKDEN